MSSVNSVGDTNNIQIPAGTNSSSQPTTSSPDTLAQSLNSSQLSALFSNNPSLAAPNEGFPTLAQFINAISQSSLEFRHQIGASDYTDQLTRRKPSQAAALQAASLAQLFSKRDNAVEETNKTTQQKMQTITDIQNQVNNLKDQVNMVNQGNAEEQAQASQQMQNYNNFINALKSQLGASENADGSFTIPPGQSPDETASRIALYNQLATQYGQQVIQFNSYADARRSLLDGYNSQANANNDAQDANKKAIDDIIKKYNLSGVLDQNNIPSLNPPTVDTRDTSQLFDNSAPTQNIGGLPASVQVGKPPSWVQDSSNGVTPLSSISYPQLTQDQLSKIKDAIFTAVYNSIVLPLNVTQQLLNQWAFLNMLSVYRPVQDSAPDPLLNTKPIIKRIVPDSISDSLNPIGSQAGSQGASALAVQALGLSNPHLEGILNKALASQVIQNLNNTQFYQQLDQKQQDELTNQILLLSAALLGTNSLQSLLPSLSPIQTYLSSLPKNSPVYSILFALSFVNRAQESTQNNLNATAIETLLQNSPQFANLTPEQKAALTADLAPIVNLNVLLVAAKLLASNLGEPNLIAQLSSSLLPSSIDPSTLNQIIQTNTQEANQTQAQLQSDLKNHFIGQGYQSAEAQFLAKVGAELTAQGPFSPSATSISNQTIQTPVLLDSVKANLVLSGFPLDQASRITESAVNRTLTADPQSYNQFVAELETNLRLSGASKYALDTANSAVVLPIKDALPTQSIPQNEIAQTLTAHVQSLLTPHVGADTSQAISSELTKALFGTVQPDSADRTQTKPPLSLVNTIKEQITVLAEKHSDQVGATFKEFMRDSESLNTFLEKLMDPAHLFVYSVASGLMYAGHEPSNWKRSIDIPI